MAQDTSFHTGPFNEIYYPAMEISLENNRRKLNALIGSPVITSESNAVPPYGHPYMSHAIFPFRYPITKEYLAQLSMASEKRNIESMHDLRVQQSEPNDNQKILSSNVHSRRRAQNRASQRAFRERKRKYIGELESRLECLQTQYAELTASYDSLRIEHARANEEVERLRRESIGSQG
ncbi:hypothetical protein F5884DRAFT_890550 [Xylogone sp. PMI_703]|nr:hypothetical protein F5884DRAFT_890550 [Xylogone sp. PMI_703]